EPFQQSARTSLERLTNQRHPAVTGAGNERLTMKAVALQLGNADRQTRFLKIEEIGDFALGKVIPRLRIAGQWFERAGFNPGHRVQVLVEQPGSMTLRFVEQGREAAL